MATIKKHLDELQKTLEKQKQTPQKQLEEIEEELKLLKDTKILNHKGEEIKLQKEKDLLQLKEILQKQLYYKELDEEIKQNKYNNYIDKNIKKQIEQEIFLILDEYFQENEEKKHVVYKVLNRSNNKKEILKDVINSYDIEGDLILVIYELYDKTLKKLYNFYKFDILEEQKTIKEKQEEQKQARKELKQRLRNRTIYNFGVSALIYKCSKGTKRR